MADSKFTDGAKERLLVAIRKGLYPETACALAGICKQTLHNWLTKGRRFPQHGNPYWEFALDFESALAESEERDIEVIDAARTEHWQAAAWKLERRHPERWGRQDRKAIETEVQAELDLALDKLAAKLTHDEFRRVLEALSEGDDGADGAQAPLEPEEQH